MRIRSLILSTALVTGSYALAAPITFTTTLNGANENPPINTTGTGFATISLDTAAHILTVDVTFSGLTTPAIAAHIHCCVAPPGNAGVATQVPSFVGFPNATSGTYSHTFDTSLLSTYNPAFVTANGGTSASAEAVFVAGLLGGQEYLNIHTTENPGGEIRGFLIPEPSTWFLAGLALVGIGLVRRRTR